MKNLEIIIYPKPKTTELITIDTVMIELNNKWFLHFTKCLEMDNANNEAKTEELIERSKVFNKGLEFKKTSL